MIDASGSRRVDPTVTWTSDASAASVDASGVVFGVSPGSATITAAAESKSGTAAVTVEVVTFATVQPGAYHSCGLTVGGAPYCWGHNTYGSVGNGSTANSRTPVAVSGGRAFVSVGTGNIFACGLTADSAAYCWGNNSAGQLGIGPGGGPELCSAEPCSTAPVLVSGGLKFGTLSVGYWHACGLTADSTAYCWGDNGDGQLGATTTETCNGFGDVISGNTLPGPVQSAPKFATLSAGSFPSCGVAAAGDGYCWGYNGNGELGDGTGANSPTPVLIAGGLSFGARSEEHTSELQSLTNLVCRLLLEKKK